MSQLTRIAIRQINKLSDSPIRALTLCLVLVICAYSQSLNNGFVIDDFSFIVDWPLIQDLRHLPQFFGPNNQPAGEEGVYSPLKTVFHAMNYHLWGQDPFGYHLVALLIHLLSTIYVYRITRLLTMNTLLTFLTTLFFGLHPIHVEAITFLTASIDTLGVLFMFISFYCYIQHQKLSEPIPRNDSHTKTAQQKLIKHMYFKSVIFSFLAIFTHELCLSLPFLFLLYEIYFQPDFKKNMRHTIGRLAPFLGIFILYILLKFWILKSISRGGYLADSFYLTMLLMIKAWVKYCLVILFPFSLAIKPIISKGIFAVDVWDFDHEAVLNQSLFDPQILSAILFLSTLLFITLWTFKRSRLVSFCISYFFVCLLPASNIIPSECFFAERYLYPGSWAFCLLLAYGFSLWLDTEKPGFVNIFQTNRTISKAQIQSGIIISLIILTSFYGVRTYLRNKDFRDQVSFFRAEVKANPQSAHLWSGLAKAYLRDRQPLKAVTAFKRSVAIKPKNPLYYFGWAEAYMSLEEFSYAETVLKKALELKPDYAEAYFNLAVVKVLQGDMEKAEEIAAQSFDLFEKQGLWEDTQAYKKNFYEFTYAHPIQKPNP